MIYGLGIRFLEPYPRASKLNGLLYGIDILIAKM